ncbi:hypothetical protein [Amycolatopsis sp. NPDC059657]|uniref:hypothetical protein n=1 Tax=Amycolatopsis sp. NPDC059657 TaxID=3346899 RepID=UPI00366C3840
MREMRAYISARLAVAATVAAVAATVPVVTAVPASAATEHFVRFSNKSLDVYRWCVRALDAQSNVLKGDCDKVGLRQKSTFYVPTNATKIMYEYVDNTVGGGKGGPYTVDNNKNWCFRVSFSGSFHEATEQPCTLK